MSDKRKGNFHKGQVVAITGKDWWGIIRRIERHDNDTQDTVFIWNGSYEWGIYANLVRPLTKKEAKG